MDFTLSLREKSRTWQYWLNLFYTNRLTFPLCLGGYERVALIGYPFLFASYDIMCYTTYRKGGAMKVTVYHAPEYTFDGYTIVIERGKDFPVEFWGMGDQGQYHFCGDSRDGYKKGKHLGKRIPFHDTPIEVQRSVINNLLSIEE